MSSELNYTKVLLSQGTTIKKSKKSPSLGDSPYKNDDGVIVFNFKADNDALLNTEEKNKPVNGGKSEPVTFMGKSLPDAATSDANKPTIVDEDTEDEFQPFDDITIADEEHIQQSCCNIILAFSLITDDVIPDFKESILKYIPKGKIDREFTSLILNLFIHGRKRTKMKNILGNLPEDFMEDFEADPSLLLNMSADDLKTDLGLNSIRARFVHDALNSRRPLIEDVVQYFNDNLFNGIEDMQILNVIDITKIRNQFNAQNKIRRLGIFSKKTTKTPVSEPVVQVINSADDVHDMKGIHDSQEKSPTLQQNKKKPEKNLNFRVSGGDNVGFDGNFDATSSVSPDQNNGAVGAIDNFKTPSTTTINMCDSIDRRMGKDENSTFDHNTHILDRATNDASDLAGNDPANLHKNVAADDIKKDNIDMSVNKEAKGVGVSVEPDPEPEPLADNIHDSNESIAIDGNDGRFASPDNLSL